MRLIQRDGIHLYGPQTDFWLQLYPEDNSPWRPCVVAVEMLDTDEYMVTVRSGWFDRRHHFYPDTDNSELPLNARFLGPIPQPDLS